MKFIWRQLYLLLTFTGFLLAQDQSQVEIKTKFRVLGLGPMVTNLYFEEKKKDISVEILPDTRSTFINYEGPADLVFYTLKTNEKGESIKNPVGQVNLKNKSNWQLLLFLPNKNKSDLQEISAIADDLTAFPPSNYAFYNIAASSVQVLVDNKKTILPPRQWTLIKPEQTVDKRVAFVQVASMQSGKLTTHYSNNWAIFPNARSLVVVYPDNENRNNVLVRRLTESSDFPPDFRKTTP